MKHVRAETETTEHQRCDGREQDRRNDHRRYSMPENQQRSDHQAERTREKLGESSWSRRSLQAKTRAC